MIVYIAGKMNGLPDFGRPRFRAAQEYLESAGHTVINPALLPVALDDKRYMPICIAMIDASDAVYMLDTWTESLGARVERLYAERQGKQILYQ